MKRKVILRAILTALFFAISYSFLKSYFSKYDVKQLLSLHADAMGGKEKWASLNSYQRILVRPNGLKLSMTCLMPDKIILDFKKDSFHLIKGYDGSEGYIVRNGKYEPMRPGEAIEMAEEPHYYSELIFALDEGQEVQLLGEEEVEDINCYKINVRKSSKDEQLYWLNSKTFLIEQTGEYSEDKAHDGIYYKTRLMDYRDVDGYLFPFQQVLIPSDRDPIQSTITATKVNFDISPEEFKYSP